MLKISITLSEEEMGVGWGMVRVREVGGKGGVGTGIGI